MLGGKDFPSPADIATLANVFIGFVGVSLAVMGNCELASRLFFVCLFMDGVDGLLAKLYWSSGSGELLDRVSDRLNQCFLPATVLVAWVSRWGGVVQLALSVLTGGLLVTLGVTRLAFKKGYVYFRGLPLHVPAGITCCWVLIGFKACGTVLLIILLVLTVLTILPVRYPRSSSSMGKGGFVRAIWWLRFPVALLPAAFPFVFNAVIPKLYMACLLLYACLGPLSSLLRRCTT